jgi:hypothetical protein
VVDVERVAGREVPEGRLVLHHQVVAPEPDGVGLVGVRVVLAAAPTAFTSLKSRA